MSIKITKKSKLSALQFLKKYQLIPRMLRCQFLDMLRKSFSFYEMDDNNNDIFDNLILTLIGYELSHEDHEVDYDDLELMLEEYVYAGACIVYYDVATKLLSYIQYRKPILTFTDIIKFNKKRVLQQIKEDVAYRPGNVGYEKTKEHFENIYANFYL